MLYNESSLSFVRAERLNGSTGSTRSVCLGSCLVRDGERGLGIDLGGGGQGFVQLLCLEEVDASERNGSSL